MVTAEANRATTQTGARNAGPTGPRTTGETSERSTIGYSGCDHDDNGDEQDFEFAGVDDAEGDDPEWQKDASEYPGIPTDDDFPIITKWEQERALERRKLRDPDA